MSNPNRPADLECELHHVDVLGCTSCGCSECGALVDRATMTPFRLPSGATGYACAECHAGADEEDVESVPLDRQRRVIGIACVACNCPLTIWRGDAVFRCTGHAYSAAQVCEALRSAEPVHGLCRDSCSAGADEDETVETRTLSDTELMALKKEVA